MPGMLIVMSISHPKLRSFSLKASLRTPAALATWLGMVHYISTQIVSQDTDRSRGTDDDFLTDTDISVCLTKLLTNHFYNLVATVVGTDRNNAKIAPF
jgi:hypothetical protein